MRTPQTTAKKLENSKKNQETSKKLIHIRIIG